MKIKYTEEMKEKIQIGTTVATFTLVLYFVLSKFPMLSDTLHRVIRICFPFLLGFAIAFLLNPIMMFFENKVFKNWTPKGKQKRTVCLFITFVMALACVVFLFYLIIPSVGESVSDLVKNNKIYISDFSTDVKSFFKQYDLDPKQIESVIGTGDELFRKVSKMLTNGIPTIVTAGYDIMKSLFNILIGICAALYLLLDKERFHRNIKKMNYAVLPKTVAVYLQRMVQVCRKIFYDFIVGKAIDSLIIGIICYIGLSILNIEFAPLLSVIVGITNMIPVFGPFIGAVPGGIILLIVNPIQAVYFLIFIFALQQFDGNILGPLILGDKLNIASFWILFSVTIGGALFGIIGMFIGVPTFAFIYYAVKEYINLRLLQKQINIDNEEVG